MPTALITGVSGQDGSYLAELLLGKGYAVFGIVRRDPSAPYPNLREIRDDVTLLQGDLLDPMTLVAAIDTAQPDEVYNLAADSFVPASWRRPVLSAQFGAVGVTALIEAVRIANPEIRLLQASSSEIFGATDESPQRESTPFRPRTPYGIAKLHGHLMVGAYRERYGMHLSSAIAYNHESPRRPVEFVTRKVTRAAAAIKLGLQDQLRMGDMSAVRDWGYAPDFVEAMWLMLRQERGDDYVLATGRAHSVRDLADVAFSHVGLVAEDCVVVDPELVRPSEPVALVGDPSRAREGLGWTPKTTFEDMVVEMVEADLAALGRGASV